MTRACNQNFSGSVQSVSGLGREYDSGTTIAAIAETVTTVRTAESEASPRERSRRAVPNQKRERDAEHETRVGRTAKQIDARHEPEGQAIEGV